MSKIHYFQRYSSIENTVTNNTLQLIARIYAYAPERASKLLNGICGDQATIEIGVGINQQGRSGESVPDGEILQRSFRILIESKVESEVDEDQLLRHASKFKNEEQRILLLLTRRGISDDREKRISKAIGGKYGNGIIFKNATYEDICNSLEGLFSDFESDMKELADDYVEYCNDNSLFDQSPFLMRIVPCGASLNLNKKYVIYFQPSDRGYTKHSYVGIYAYKRVHCFWAIDSIFDADYDGTKLCKKLVQGRDTEEYDGKILDIIADAKKVCGYNIETGHRFFCGKKAINTNYVKISPGGIQSARFVNLRNKIGPFINDEDIAAKLNGKNWE